MEETPLEIKEEILLQTPIEDIPSLCQSNRDYHSLCSQPSFWRRRFLLENIPLLEEGENFSQWLRIYRTALLSLEIVHAVLRTLNKFPGRRIKLFHFSLASMGAATPFSIGSITPTKVREVFNYCNYGWVESFVKRIIKGASRSPLTYELAQELYPLQNKTPDKTIPVSCFREKEGEILYRFGPYQERITLSQLEILLYKLTYMGFLKRTLFLEEEPLPLKKKLLSYFL